jgi:hypothetical protein
MTSTVWRDGYGGSVEVFHGAPEVCPDGQVRTWCDVVVTTDGYTVGAPAVELRLQASELAELADVLQAVAAAVTA